MDDGNITPQDAGPQNDTSVAHEAKRLKARSERKKAAPLA